MTTLIQKPRDVVLDDLSIQVRADTEDTSLHWTGRSGARDPAEHLLPFLEGVVAWAKQRGGRVVLHLEKTDFLNSSTLAVVMRMVRLATEKNVGTDLYYDATVLWQRFAFAPMAVLGRGPHGLVLHALTATAAAQP